MLFYYLSDEMQFPSPHLANDEGILAIGGDLNPERLLLAYRSGIFPWYSENEPIIWWSPDPRFVLYPEDLKVSKSMRQVLRQKKFEIRFDTAFDQVILECSRPRKGEEVAGTWITPEMMRAYRALHRMGVAHSVEAWKDDELVGGLYGVALGRIFFGESMFTHQSNASKAAFITLVQKLVEQGFELIDSQVYTRHLESLGAVNISREAYLKELRAALLYPTITGNWGEVL